MVKIEKRSTPIALLPRQRLPSLQSRRRRLQNIKITPKQKIHAKKPPRPLKSTPLTTSRTEEVEAQAPEGAKGPSGVRTTPHGRRLSRDRRHQGDPQGAYGFVANPRLPLWENVEAQLKTVDVTELPARPKNNACDNPLQSRPLPDGNPQLLGLGLNYCVKPSSTKEMTKGTFARLEKDVRQTYHLRRAEESGDYEPRLYIKSDYAFKDARKDTEQALVDFKRAINKKQRLTRQRGQKKAKTNLTPLRWKFMLRLKDHDVYIVVQGDKNLGPCIWERKALHLPRIFGTSWK